MSMIFKPPALSRIDAQVLELIQRQKERLRYLSDSHPRRWTDLLSRNIFARAIQGSNSIEGYNVSQEDAIAAVIDEEPLDAKTEAWRALTGYREALTYIINLATDTHFEYHPQLIRSLHFMMLNYDMSKHPGQWRPGSISVIQEGTGQLMYQAPDVELVPDLVHELIDQLRNPGQVPVIVRAALAHLTFTRIHPFSDGNGRMACALQTLVLARDGAPNPIFSSIEEWLGRNRQGYYDILAAVGQGSWHPENDALPWVRFCLRAHYQQMTTIIKRDEEMSKVFQEIDQLVKRERLPSRCEFSLVDAAYGLRINRSRYMTEADVTEFIASRDLKRLSDLELLIPHGEKRGRYYTGSPLLREIRQRNRDNSPMPDPYQLVETQSKTQPADDRQPVLPGLPS
jgi:Fic family protein